MFKFQNKIISSRISRFNVYLDTLDEHMKGILFNENYNCMMTFNGFSSMISTLEEFFNFVNFPQASHQERSFKKKISNANPIPPKSLKDADISEIDGREPDFVLHVKFRRDATWQGSIHIDGEEKNFLSDLELNAIIIDSFEKKIKKVSF